MDVLENIDQFQVLEDKVVSLIELVAHLRKGKEDLTERLQIQEGRSADLTEQVEILKSGMDSAKKRIVSILERIEAVDI